MNDVTCTPADDVFEKPVRLQADGEVIDTGKASWAHSAPCVEDIDGDGLPDLIVGDFSGKLSVYRNVGTRNKPAYHFVGRDPHPDRSSRYRRQRQA